MDSHLQFQHERLLESLIQRGIKNTIVDAIRNTPRALFVPQHMQDIAYEDSPLPIGSGQTISQPYIVAYMIQMARIGKTSKVLEIGTGSGWLASIVCRLAKDVYGVERIPALYTQGKSIFEQLGLTNIHCMLGDGTLGWKENAPFDAIIVSCSSPHVPTELTDQLAENGTLIMPVGDLGEQVLMRITKARGELQKEVLDFVRFVPLIKEHTIDN